MHACEYLHTCYCVHIPVYHSVCKLMSVNTFIYVVRIFVVYVYVCPFVCCFLLVHIIHTCLYAGDGWWTDRGV